MLRGILRPDSGGPCRLGKPVARRVARRSPLGRRTAPRGGGPEAVRCGPVGARRCRWLFVR